MAGVRKGRELGHETVRERGGRKGMPASKPLFLPFRLLISKNNAAVNDQLSNKSGRDARILVILVVYRALLFFCFPKTRNLKWRYYKKKFKCGRPLKESSLKVETTRAELHKIQHKSIQVVTEGIRLENYLIKNVAALRNFQCNVCLRRIKTLCRHSLNFYQDELDPVEHTKENW